MLFQPNKMTHKPLLVVITGPTGIGKSDAAIKVANHFDTEIISADSRQIYRGLEITSAAPDAADLAKAKHHLVGSLDLADYYSASCFEHDALAILDDIFSRKKIAVLCGGSQMYIDALCNGIDEMPDISETVRKNVATIYRIEGLEALLEQLRSYDPDYYEIVDRNNVKRVMHALEVCLESGKTYTSFRTGKRKDRPFDVIKFILTAPREVMFERINTRVQKMADAGMVDEVRSVAHLRHLNSLNTVGVKEILKHLDGEWTLQEALSRLAKNTRVYAKKQLTWLAKDTKAIRIDITTENPADTIIHYIVNQR